MRERIWLLLWSGLGILSLVLLFFDFIRIPDPFVGSLPYHNDFPSCSSYKLIGFIGSKHWFVGCSALLFVLTCAAMAATGIVRYIRKDLDDTLGNTMAAEAYAYGADRRGSASEWSGRNKAGGAAACSKLYPQRKRKAVQTPASGLFGASSDLKRSSAEETASSAADVFSGKFVFHGRIFTALVRFLPYFWGKNSRRRLLLQTFQQDSVIKARYYDNGKYDTHRPVVRRHHRRLPA